jgi:hypothetical protein
LHLSLKKCKKETTYVEFLEWLEFFREEDESEFEKIVKQDYYLAQVAAMVVATNSKDPKSIKVTDFLIKTDKKKEERKLTKEERTVIAKSFWMRTPKKKGTTPKSKKQAGEG